MVLQTCRKTVSVGWLSTSLWTRYSCKLPCFCSLKYSCIRWFSSSISLVCGSRTSASGVAHCSSTFLHSFSTWDIMRLPLKTKIAWSVIKLVKHECIPVGCVPPACWPYPSMHCVGGCLLGGSGDVFLGGGCLPRGVCLCVDDTPRDLR